MGRRSRTTMLSYGEESSPTVEIASICLAVLMVMGLAQGQQVAEAPQERYLAAHNNARQALQVGIPNLVWNYSLELYASDWAQILAENDCVRLQSGGPYGENILWSSWQSTPEEAVSFWVEEKQYYHALDNTCEEDQDHCSHYAQVVWRNTEELGCGTARCDDGSWLHVCSYDPPVDHEESPYQPSVRADS